MKPFAIAVRQGRRLRDWWKTRRPFARLVALFDAPFGSESSEFTDGHGESSESLGRRGERAAARYLKAAGLRVVESGVRSGLGEIDLIAVDDDTVVFVEVKTRKNHRMGHPAEAVHSAKQAKLTQLALRYLKRHDLLETRSRFDILALTWPDDAAEPHIEHIRHAFSPVGRGQFFS